MNDKERQKIVSAALKLYEDDQTLCHIIEVTKAFYPEDKQAPFIAEKAIEMFSSLLIAIDSAGGNIPLSELIEYKLLELISHLCTNNIRFCFIKPKKKKD